MTVMKHHSHTHQAALSLIAILMAVATCINLSGGNNRWQQGARERMADYLYLDALRQSSLDSLSNSFESMKWAYYLDSTDTEKGYKYGCMLLVLGSNQNDMELFQRGLAMMRRHVDAVPTDYYSAYYYANVNDQLQDTDESLRVWAIIDSLNPTKEEVTYKYAEALNNTRDSANMVKALSLYNRLEEIEGIDLGISAHKIRTYFALGDTAAISTELDRLFAASPGSAANHTYASDLYVAMDRLDRAMEQINIAASLDSLNGEILNKRADLMLSRGDTIGYCREVYLLVRNSDLPLESKLETVKGFTREFYADSTRHESIANLHKALIEKYPDNTDARDLYTTFLLVTKNYDEAASIVKQTLELDIDNESRWAGIVQILMITEKPEDAIAMGELGRKRFPSSQPLLLNLAMAYIHQDQYTKALSTYQTLLDSNPDAGEELRSEWTSAMGDVYHEMGDDQQSYDCYERAIELNPGNLMALNNYAYFLSLSGKDLDRAEKMSAKVVRDMPYEPTYLDTYAWVLYKRGEYERAREYIDTAIEYSEDSPGPDLLEHAADIYDKLGLADEAAAYRKQAKEAAEEAESNQ